MNIVTLVILSVCLGILIVAVLVDYIKIKLQAKQINAKFALIQAEITESRELEKTLREQNNALQLNLRVTHQDPVTGLLGWKFFEDRLGQNLKDSQRHQGCMGIMFVDIDGFKVVNNAISHLVGDALLKEVGQRLQSCIRSVDSLSRFSKDTFVVLLSQLAKPETAAIVAQRMLAALADPITVKGHELYTTVCIGIATYPVDGETVDDVLRSADHALHLAKEKGKHIYRFYHNSMHDRSQRELVLYTGLSRDSILDELVLYYQPVVNVLDKKIICMDVLMQWQHPELGLIGAQELEHQMDKQRKSMLISEWGLRVACKQFLTWQSLGFNPGMIGLSLSIKQLENSQFIYNISRILQELQFKPECLLLEIKEGVEPVSFDVIEKAFNMLKYMGVNVAINNFGASIVSLAYLKNQNVHYLKLYGALIEDVQHNPSTQALVKSLVFMASNLDIKLIVQGVESREQLDWLQNLGCTLLEGRYLGAPAPKAQVQRKVNAIW